MSRYLIARLSALGDVVCTLPAAVAIRRGEPEAEIVWVVDRRFSGIADCCSALDRVVELPRDRVEQKRTIRDLGEFDIAFDLQGLLKSGLVVRAAKAKRKLGYHWQREGSALFSSKVLPDPTSIHVTDQYVDVVRAAGFAAHRAEYMLEPIPEDVQSIQSRLAEAGRDPSRPLVLCNAGAGWPTKRWVPARFAELADRLVAEGADVAFLGAPSDREVFDEVRAHGAANALDMVGKSKVRELVALVAEADVHVGGDTGSTHLAVALDKPAVGIYSITRPERSGPYGQLARCVYDPNGLDRIETDAVHQKVREALDSS